MSTVSGGQGNIVTTGLVLNLDAANPRSYAPPFNGTTWTDLSGNGNNGTLVSGSVFSGSNGGFLRFDGTNDYADLPFNNRSSTVNTVEMFFRWRSGIGGMFMGFQNYTIWTDNGYLGFNTGASDVYGISSTRVNSLNLIGTNNSNWHHYVFVFTDQVQNNRMYIDGNLQTLSQQLGTTNLTSTRTFPSTLRLSGWINYVGFYIAGDYSIFRVYNRELNASEVLQNFNATRARFGI